MLSRSDLEMMSWFMHPGDVVLDIGAHQGFFTHLALNLGAKACVCVEPEPDNFRLLDRFANKHTNVRTFECALGAKEDKLPLYLSEHSLGHTINLRHKKCLASIFPAKDSVEVIVKTVDWVIEDCWLMPTVWKLDVEGHEAEVLKGAQKSLKKIPPRTILAEWRFDLAELRELLPGYAVRQFLCPDSPIPPTFLFTKET